MDNCVIKLPYRQVTVNEFKSKGRYQKFLCAEISGWLHIKPGVDSEKNVGSHWKKNYIFNKNTFSTDDDNCRKLLRQLKMSLPFSHCSLWFTAAARHMSRTSDTNTTNYTTPCHTAMLRHFYMCHTKEVWKQPFPNKEVGCCFSMSSMSDGCCWHLQSLKNKTGVIIKWTPLSLDMCYSDAGTWWTEVNI